MMRELAPELNIGDLIVVTYDCWIHSLAGSQFLREGICAIVIGNKEASVYKPIHIHTNCGKVGWVYSSNIKKI
jgi:hypothetical protein